MTQNKSKYLYDVLIDEELISGSYESFVNQYTHTINQIELYREIVENNMTDLPFDDFRSKYFSFSELSIKSNESMRPLETSFSGKVLDFYWDNEFLLKNIGLFLSILFIAFICIILYRKLKKRGVSIVYVALQLAIPLVIGYFSLYYFKQPNAKLLKILVRGESKWKRDDYELYIRKLDGFYSLKHFDLNWLAGVLTVSLTAFVVWFLFKKARRSELESTL